MAIAGDYSRAYLLALAAAGLRAMLDRMALITFGDGRQLSVDVGSPTAIFKGAGSHRLQFPVALEASRRPAGQAMPGRSA